MRDDLSVDWRDLAYLVIATGFIAFCINDFSLPQPRDKPSKIEKLAEPESKQKTSDEQIYPTLRTQYFQNYKNQNY